MILVVARVMAAGLIAASVLQVAAAQPKAVADARAVLRQGVASSDPAMRAQAIATIGLIGLNDEVRTRLEGFLKDGNVEVRIAAIRTLADLKSSASQPALEGVLAKDDVPEVKFAAAKALFRLHDEKGKKWLEDLYNGSQKATSSMMASQSRKFFGNFHSFESATTFIVSEGIGYVPVPGVGEGFSAVTQLVSDPDLSPRASALILLTKTPNEETDAMLKKALKDSDWSVRASAAQMIAYSGRANLRDNLIPLFNDKNEKVRFRAAGAYLHLMLLASKAAGPEQ